ncbi:MAG: hypothetical protein WCS55_09040 [Sulfuricurvum sp.]|uniref:hypothetical protein n=1 Tax=Sulfuricurvum sp. TaxID=2025608 RepID=UPI00260BB62B|nr:hypothetical protein [uncultured Sulfuricurvum sp.]MDD2839051.1 hypothetical protein [Sulfuricurvum sp.]
MIASFVVAMLSSMLIVTGSLYSYRNMIQRRVEDVDIEDNKDIIDMMDDPYDLYEQERTEEVTDIKQMIKEEKARQKGNVIKNTAQNASAWVSVYRLIPYAFLVLGFIALQNNHTLTVLPYLVGLAAGIPVGYRIAKKLFI